MTTASQSPEIWFYYKPSTRVWVMTTKLGALLHRKINGYLIAKYSDKRPLNRTFNVDPVWGMPV
jgi:hypothetical protein